MSIFALTAEDAARVRNVVATFDPDDAFARRPRPPVRAGFGRAPSFRFAVPAAAQREFFGNSAYAQLFEDSIGRVRGLGGDAIEVDITPLLEAAKLLYGGPWIAERYVATASILESQPEAMLEITRRIIQARVAKGDGCLSRSVPPQGADPQGRRHLVGRRRAAAADRRHALSHRRDRC